MPRGVKEDDNFHIGTSDRSCYEFSCIYYQKSIYVYQSKRQNHIRDKGETGPARHARFDASRDGQEPLVNEGKKE